MKFASFRSNAPFQLRLCAPHGRFEINNTQFCVDQCACLLENEQVRDIAFLVLLLCQRCPAL